LEFYNHELPIPKLLNSTYIYPREAVNASIFDKACFIMALIGKISLEFELLSPDQYLN